MRKLGNVNNKRRMRRRAIMRAELYDPAFLKRLELSVRHSKGDKTAHPKDIKGPFAWMVKGDAPEDKEEVVIMETDDMVEVKEEKDGDGAKGQGSEDRKVESGKTVKTSTRPKPAKPPARRHFPNLRSIRESNLSGRDRYRAFKKFIQSRRKRDRKIGMPPTYQRKMVKAEEKAARQRLRRERERRM